ncbi:hypothetical protein Rsub_02801 [Raphidocelis subcapitata]|uniref:Uncharacterized protein n=1 Tax=Raphidocelis subcapitata TaxID=307507 RepID=A0A2V0NX01_9CHLO|nr:hypothetical protein Rsub_02801 [Raphidocelis subcapitata]|eukprot:GBF90093.1 hypothetical protein Rsub_02801 [Raphidocelis subcapitata]
MQAGLAARYAESIVWRGRGDDREPWEGADEGRSFRQSLVDAVERRVPLAADAIRDWYDSVAAPLQPGEALRCARQAVVSAARALRSHPAPHPECSRGTVCSIPDKGQHSTSAHMYGLTWVPPGAATLDMEPLGFTPPATAPPATAPPDARGAAPAAAVPAPPDSASPGAAAPRGAAPNSGAAAADEAAPPVDAAAGGAEPRGASSGAVPSGGAAAGDALPGDAARSSGAAAGDALPGNAEPRGTGTAAAGDTAPSGAVPGGADDVAAAGDAVPGGAAPSGRRAMPVSAWWRADGSPFLSCRVLGLARTYFNDLIESDPDGASGVPPVFDTCAFNDGHQGRWEGDRSRVAPGPAAQEASVALYAAVLHGTPCAVVINFGRVSCDIMRRLKQAVADGGGGVGFGGIAAILDVTAAAERAWAELPGMERGLGHAVGFTSAYNPPRVWLVLRAGRPPVLVLESEHPSRAAARDYNDTSVPSGVIFTEAVARMLTTNTPDEAKRVLRLLAKEARSRGTALARRALAF